MSDEKKPLAIDLFCGLGGWTEGLLAEGWRVVGFDIERHRYPRVKPVGEAQKNGSIGGSWFAIGSPGQKAVRGNPDGRNGVELVDGEWSEYPAQLVLQDVLTMHGRQFKDAALIVASPPCQEYSYMAMPWSKAKQIAAEYRDGTRDRAKLTALFDACFRIQREASEAAGKHIPLVVENVRGAQPYVGRAKWHFGSFYLWGDVPALMPMTKSAAKMGWLSQAGDAPMRRDDRKGHGGAWFKDADTADGMYGSGNFRIGVDGRKAPTGTQWFNDGPRTPDSLASMGGKSSARKAASAHIAKIPLVLSQHIARVYKP